MVFSFVDERTAFMLDSPVFVLAESVNIHKDISFLLC